MLCMLCFQMLKLWSILNRRFHGSERFNFFKSTDFLIHLGYFLLIMKKVTLLDMSFSIVLTNPVLKLAGC